MIKKEEQFHWQRGYRCHGFYNGDKQYGLVSLSPKLNGIESIYGFSIYLLNLQYNNYRCNNLKEGKRIVENIIKEYLQKGYISFDLLPYLAENFEKKGT